MWGDLGRSTEADCEAPWAVAMGLTGNEGLAREGMGEGEGMQDCWRHKAILS